MDPWGIEYVYQVFNDGAGLYPFHLWAGGRSASGRAFLQVHSGRARAVSQGEVVAVASATWPRRAPVM